MFMERLEKAFERETEEILLLNKEEYLKSNLEIVLMFL